MAGTKKKKKPAANPSRGFTTVSVASKPRAEVSDGAESAVGSEPGRGADGNQHSEEPLLATSKSTSSPNKSKTDAAGKDLSPEEFEQQLEESDLQLLVDKHSQKVSRDSNRQCSRLETDRRLLRSQADAINTRKWLPQNVIDQVFDLIQAESRFSSSSATPENNMSGRLPPEEELVMRLWTLQQTLAGVGFTDKRVDAVTKHILDMSPKISAPTKDSIWGLEEAMDWVARECPIDELPAYDPRVKPMQKQLNETSDLDNGFHQMASVTPSPVKHAGQGSRGTSPLPKKKAAVACDSDIEPDELIPEYLATKSKLLEVERMQRVNTHSDPNLTVAHGGGEDDELKEKLRAKIMKIEADVLFDRFVADQQWQQKKTLLEREFASARRQIQKKTQDPAQSRASTLHPSGIQEAQDASDGDISREADRIAAEVLAQAEDEDSGLADLFASLPTADIDEATGKSNTILNDSNGVKIIIRNFGEWTGINPTRALLEACRARDSSVKISNNIVSQSPFAHRCLLKIHWKKPQDLPPAPATDGLYLNLSPTIFVFEMGSIATPDAKQSEAFIATWALFHIFGTSPKEEKVFLRLPPVWRELWTELADARKAASNAKDKDAIRKLRNLVRLRQDQELEDGVILQSAFRGRGSSRYLNDPSESNQEADKQPVGGQESFKQLWNQKSSTPRYQAMLLHRQQLPMWSFRQAVTDAVDREQVVIICGETGCGKSTQVPAFLLEHELSQGKPCKIYCTEPRRISALSLARRVSEELGEGRGDLGTPRSLVGYSIRLESHVSKETRLVYATTGIVMRMLEGSNDLQDITHLVLDEVHERSIDSDFLLIVLKRLLVRRKELKVVLMSATVDAKRFSEYLGGAPILTVPGRTFPVNVRYLEDAVELTGYSASQDGQVKMIDLDDDDQGLEPEDGSTVSTKELSQYSGATRQALAQLDEYRIEFDLIVQLISKIATDPLYIIYSKAVLVFLPGIAEIRTLNDFLCGHPDFAKDWLIYPLHSSIATEDQEAAFHIPPDGMRKIVLATNIAETGITIPDVTCVIDTGKHREMRFDERRQLSRLIDTFISRANAKQRRGRAGRVQEGLCFHMFTKRRHDTLLSDQQTPEMLRLSLQDLAIRVKICKIGGIEETLGGALDPPSPKNIRRAIDALVDVRALTVAEELTPLGHQLARLPLDVFLGKLILFGSVFKCLDMAVTTAAILSSKSPFSAPFGQRAQADLARLSFRRADSDLLTVYNAYQAWKRVCRSASAASGNEVQFCRKNFLSQQTLANIEDLKGQLLSAIVESGFLSLTGEERQALNRLRPMAASRRRQQHFFEVPQRANLHSENDAITTAVITWSFYPKLLVRDIIGSRALRNVGNNQSISVHPSSVNRQQTDLKWLSYYHIMKSKAVYHAHETTVVDAFPIALLCGEARVDMFSGVLILDGNRARFSFPDWKSMLVFKVLRTRLRELLTRSFKQPGKLLTQQHTRWLEMWQKIFCQDECDKMADIIVRKG